MPESPIQMEATKVKETKNTIRYDYEFGSCYLPKAEAARFGDPKTLLVTIAQLPE